MIFDIVDHFFKMCSIKSYHKIISQTEEYTKCDI